MQGIFMKCFTDPKPFYAHNDDTEVSHWNPPLITIYASI